jgi:hypothetical protein
MAGCGKLTWTGWLGVCALLFCQSSWPADDSITLGSLVKSSQYILVGRILSTELISASFRKQSVDCGVSATVRVLENVIGTAPEIITVGFQVAPLTGKSYFLPLTNVPAAASIDPPKRRNDADQALALCRTKLPQLQARQDSVTDIVQVMTGNPDRPFPFEFLQVPKHLWLPSVIPTHTYEATEPVPDLTTVEGQLMPALLRNGAQIIRWYELRRQFCRLTPETSADLYCN